MVVVTVKSSPEREKTFSFIWRVSWFGKAKAGLGPKGGLKAGRGDIVSVLVVICMGELKGFGRFVELDDLIDVMYTQGSDCVVLLVFVY